MNDPAWIVVWIVLVVAAVAVGAWYYFTRIKPRKGKMQSRAYNKSNAVGAARRFARSNGFRFIAPATLRRGEASAELDALVVGYFGVLGVKALGYNGDIYGTEKDKTWAQVMDDRRNPFPNPLTEASSDVRVIRDALLAAKLRQVPVEVVCVFTNPKAQLALPRSIEFYTVKTFKEHLRKERFLEDTGLDLDKVEEALRQALPSPA